MSLESVIADLAARAPELRVIQTEQDTSTVALAAQAHAVEPGRIAKTLAFGLSRGGVVLVVAAGLARVDNRKFKLEFGKAKMLPAEEVVRITGHPVGGVCPFGLPDPAPEIVLDLSLKAFDEVLPAAGSVRSAVRLPIARLEQLTRGRWVDVTTSS